MGDKLECFDGGCLMTDDHSGMRTNGRCKCIENACASLSDARQIRRRMMLLLQERRALRAENERLTAELTKARSVEGVCEAFEGIARKARVMDLFFRAPEREPNGVALVVADHEGRIQSDASADTLAGAFAKLEGE